MRVAIIGAGRMGEWFAKFFVEQGFTVVVSDKDDEKLRKLKKELNVKIADNVKAVESADRILVCVPIENFEDVIKEISQHIRLGQEVMDICSIKETPVNIMHKYIKGAITLGTHPMFGPGAKSIKGQNFILTPTNAKEKALAENFGKWLKSKGANVFFTTPKEHDRIMSIVIGLPYFLSYVVCDALLSCGQFVKAKEYSGVSYKLLLTIMEALVSEQAEFTANLQMELPEIDELGQLLQRKTKEWLKIITQKEKEAFIKKVKILKIKLAKVEPQYTKSYKSMYKMLEAIGNED
ncbi:MAG: prephenate dehydrogenase/arogenate dehydrogenase family protein [Candidatus Bathyarchaeia archaeon]